MRAGQTGQGAAQNAGTHTRVSEYSHWEANGASFYNQSEQGPFSEPW